MSRTTEYFENVERSFDDFLKEGMGLDNFLAKTKFGFHNGKFNFSSKSKFSLGDRSGVDHEYTLKHKCNSGSSEFKHTASGLTSLEFDGRLHKQGDFEVTTLSKFEVDQGENRRNGNANLNLRVHHRNNALFSLGLANWGFLTAQPSVLSAYGSYGHTVDGTRLTFNGLVNYNVSTKMSPLISLMVKGTRGDFTGLLLANVERTWVENAEDSTKSTMENNVDIGFKFLENLNSSTKVGGSISHNVASKVTNAVFAASHSLDKVKVNARVGTDRTITAGITSSFDDVTLNFAANTTLNSASTTEGEAKSTKFWATYRFGLSAEFNRV